jgi:hypothetical protein
MLFICLLAVSTLHCGAFVHIQPQAGPWKRCNRRYFIGLSNPQLLRESNCRRFASATIAFHEDDEDDEDDYLDDDDLPLGKRVGIMLLRLIRNILVQILQLFRKIFVVTSITVISASFIMAQRAAIKSAQAISNAFIDVLKFIFIETFRFLLSRIPKKSTQPSKQGGKNTRQARGGSIARLEEEEEEQEETEGKKKKPNKTL